MTYTSPAVVIDNGSYTTKAGFSSDDLPSLVFNSNYIRNEQTQQVIIGDEEMESHNDQEVMKLLDNGLVYDFDNLEHNWQYVYNNIDNHNSINPKEFPLVVTEQPWNTTKNKMKACQIAFENLEVPIFSLVKNPLAQLYRCGKSTGLVIDIGSSVVSVTPILDGVIQSKCAFHSKYAGDFLNLHVLNYLESKTPVSNLLPAQFTNASTSFKQYYMSHNILQEFKNLSFNYQIKNYQLYSHDYIRVSDQPSFLDYLSDPTLNKLPHIQIPVPTLDKPESQGLTNLVYLSLKNLENTLLPQNNDGVSTNRYHRFIDIFKNLLSNVLITGGTSAANGLPDSVINNLKLLTQTYFPNYPFSYSIQQIRPNNTENAEIWDRQFGAWLGACNLASMLNDTDEKSNSAKIALDNWFVTKADYEELGEDLVAEKFK